MPNRSFTCVVYAISRTLHAILQICGVGSLRSATWLTGLGAPLIAYVDAILMFT